MNEFEEFIWHNIWRRKRMFYEGTDETPGLPWSMPWNEWNDSMFIDRLQKAKNDLDAPHNYRVWAHLHHGGDLPH